MTEPCTVTGVLRDAAGDLLTSTKLSFQRLALLQSVDGTVVAPVFGTSLAAAETVTTDGTTAAFSIDLMPGVYRLSYQGGAGIESISFAVPVAETRDLAILIGQATTIESSLAQIVFGYRQDAADSAELSQAWAEGTLPGGAGTKSAKEHAEDAEAWAEGTLPGGAGTKSAKEHAEDAEAWAEGTLPGGAGTKSAKEHAEDAETYAAQALAEKSQAELAAIAAGAPIVAALTTPTPADGTVELIAYPPGFMVYQVVSGVWSDPAYLGPLSFAQRTGPIVDLITALPDGTVAEMAGLKYIVDSTATGTASAAYDLSKDGLRPFGTPEPGHFGDDIKRAIEYKSGYTNALELPVSAWTLSSGADITAYSHITGKGDQSQIFVPAGQKGIKYTSQTGVHDDHPTNVHKDFRITGDGVLAAYPGAQNGTTVGVSYAEVPGRANLASAEGMSFELHAVGRHIKESYGQSGRNNYYRANKIGLKLELVTSYTEYDIYARYNSDVAVQILGGQNVSLIGGAIEGNIGKALEFITNPAYLWGQLNIYNVYFELNGDQAGGVESIDIPFGSNTMVNIIGGNYWTNSASGKISGPYRLGDSLLMDGATINARFYAKEVVGFRNCRGPGLGGWNCMATEALSRLFGLEEPALFHEFRPTAYEHVFNSGATGGLIIGTKVVGRGSTISPVFANLATLSYPYGITASAGAVAAENAALDYGEGSYQQVQFAASVGSFSSNYATLAAYADTTKPFRTTCVLIQPEDDCELGFVQSVGGQSITGYYRFEAGKTYRLVLAAQAPMTAGSFLRVFPLDDTGPAVNFHMHWMSQSATYREQLKIIELLVDGLL